MVPLVLSLSLAAAPELPAQVWLKTDTETSSRQHQLALDGGRVWWKPLPESGRDGGWEPLPPDGLPGPTGRLAALKELAAELVPEVGFDRPADITRISADGDNLLAISDAGRGYYLKLSSMRWTDAWGPPGARGPLLFDFAPRAVAMSHRRIPYADIDGNAHPVTAGVTTVYALSADGRELFFADPWLRPRFERRICMPLHGTLIADGLSASASTVMVIDGSGRSFTRLVDFDTLGSDPALPYSWKREKREGPAAVVRSLPSEDWKEHPRPPGPATARVALLQTGETNADRELRVEGEGGFWFKKLEDARWEFKKTGLPAGAPLVDALEQTLGPSRSVALEGKATGKGLAGVKVTVTDFDPDCSPAKVSLIRKDEHVDFTLHFYEPLFGAKKKVRALAGALVLPEAGLPGAFLSQDVKAILGANPFLEVALEVDGAKVRLKSKGPGKPALVLELAPAKKPK